MGLESRVFVENNEADFENKLDGFLKNFSADEIVDIKYSFTPATESSRDIFTALIIYKK
jgi:hypothetical protein